MTAAARRALCALNVLRLLPLLLLSALVASRGAFADHDDDAEQHPAHVGMWDIERSHPWRWAAAYASVIAAALLLSHACARGWL